MSYKTIVKIVVALSCLFFSTACTKKLTSDNYWNGNNQEKKFIEKTKPTLSHKNTQKKLLEDQYSLPAKPSSKKYKIGIVTSGTYWEFKDNFAALIESFGYVGWANKIAIPKNLTSCSQLIEWVNTQNYSDNIEFSQKYFCNMKWGDSRDILNELYFESTPQIDLIVAYGGMATKAFYLNDSYPIPVIADAVTDPFSAGITKTLTDSGKDFFTCKIDPEIFKQQIQVFHDAVQFSSLGIVYGDDEFGRIYGAVRDVEESAKRLSFSIVRNTNVKEEIADDTVSLYLAALEDVASKADAVYIGASTAVTEYDILPQIVAILDKYKVPSFSLEGSIRVKAGILYSLSSAVLTRSGIYNATKITHILNGVSPRSLPQHFETVPAIAVNLETADIINHKPPIEILINSEEVYIDRNGSNTSLFGSQTAIKSKGNLSDYAAKTTKVTTKYLPHKKNETERYKIALLRSGTYWEFFEQFKGIITGLQSAGWIDVSIEIPKEAKTIDDILNALGSNYSKYLEFDQNYSINLEWGEKKHEADILINNPKSDLDLILGFGGIVGKLFSAKESFSIPVLLDGITDPLGSGIIYSTADSGKDFLTCRIDPTHYQRQIKVFHDFTKFKTLGIIYGDDEIGRIYSAVNDVELMSQKLGFEIISNTNVLETVSKQTTTKYLKALENLCPKVDAIYIGASTAVTEYNITKDIATILEKYKTPSFALEGQIRVKDGILMGVSSLEIEKIGIYNANKIVAILSGISPRLLPQEFEGMPSIALNIKTAEKIELDIPLATLSSIDELFY